MKETLSRTTMKSDQLAHLCDHITKSQDSRMKLKISAVYVIKNISKIILQMIQMFWK